MAVLAEVVLSLLVMKLRLDLGGNGDDLLQRYFHNDLRSGLSLAEIMVGVAITGVVSVFAMNQLSDFTKRQWEAETKASAVAETELAAEIIKKTLPQFVHSVTNTNGENVPQTITDHDVQPPKSFWSCLQPKPERPWNSAQQPLENCAMSINYEYTNINGDAAADWVTPLEVKCVKVVDNVLRRPRVYLKEKAGIVHPTRGFGFLDSSCLSCTWDTSVQGGWTSVPQLTVRTYTFDPSTGAPTVAGTFSYPKTIDDVGSWKRQGVLAMGVCVEAPAYTENIGTLAQPLEVPRYDRWKITLVPVYSRAAPFPKGSLEDDQYLDRISAQLQANRTEILITAPQRFAPGFRITPVR